MQCCSSAVQDINNKDFKMGVIWDLGLKGFFSFFFLRFFSLMELISLYETCQSLCLLSSIVWETCRSGSQHALGRQTHASAFYTV